MVVRGVQVKGEAEGRLRCSAVSLATALGHVGLTAEQVFIGKVPRNFVLCSIISCLPSGTFSR